MTLSRQLMLSGIFLLLCLFVGMLTYVVRNTEIYVADQLASHSQDTATALGLTLTMTMKNNDLTTASRIVDAVWDRGYYSNIEVQESNGAPLIERHASIVAYKVPDWFIKLLPLPTAKKEALIMDGWRKIGKVVVESNPGFAYEQIWNTLIESLKWLALTSFFAVILGGLLLYIILRPLKAITAQAAAICNQQFPIQKALPWTIDLRQVVEAMNNMSGRLKKLFEEHAESTERLREQAYKDPLTHLGNRRYFDLQFDFILENKEKEVEGQLLLIEINEFKEYNTKFGYQEGDKLIENVAKTLSEAGQSYEGAIITHAKGASFFVILPEKTKQMGESAAQTIAQAFKEYLIKKISPISNIGHIGITSFKTGEAKKDILSKADMALRAAQSQGENAWHYVEGRPQETRGAKEWGILFDNVISQNSIVLYFQKAALWNESKIKQTQFYETLMRIRSEDQSILQAGTFMPMAEQLGKMPELDRLVIENIMAKINQSEEDKLFFVNVSPFAMDNDEFRKNLLNHGKLLGKRINQLAIEFSEQAIVPRIDKIREFYRQWSALGGRTSVDHYGKSFTSFSYLYNLKLNYLKIDGGYIRNIHENEEHQFFIRSLVDIAHSLDIFIIAEAVETQAEFDALKALKVDGVQGYYVGKPTDKEV